MAVDTDLPREGTPSRRPKHKAGWGTRRRLRKARAARTKKRGFIRRWWWLVLVLPFLGVIGVGGTLVWMYVHLDVPKAPPPLQTTYVYDARGGLLTTLHAAVNRTIIPLTDMPQVLQEAVIDTEDQGFYSHPGIDPLGIVRAAWADLTHGTIEQGGSTITQQYVKNVYTGDERTIARKVKEALLAVKLEQQYTKDQILSKYLNTIYFGHGAYGVEAAAKTYWRKDAKNLTLVESATLAAIIAAPSRYDPLAKDRATVHLVKARRNYVLERMVAQGHLDAAKAAELRTKKVRTHPFTQGSGHFPYFTDYARRTLIDKLAKTTTDGDREAAAKLVYGGGLKVTTTLNPSWQVAAQDAIDAHLGSKGDPQAALVAIDPRNGAVRALVGGSNFQHSQVNLATGYGSPGRSAGSAFKVFTLAAAMEQKYSLNSVWNGPSSIVIPDKQCAGANGPWNPSNAGDGEAGVFTLAEATAHSVNTVFAQLVVDLHNGPQAVVDVAHKMGIRSTLDPVCSITLGTQLVTPLEMTDAYATLAAQGTHHPATPLESVKSRKGQDLIHYPVKGDEALTKNQANLVTKALEGVVTGGTYAAGPIGRPAAGKTGTAQTYTDAWFCGYVPQLATCVWVGYQKSNQPLLSVEGVSPVYGGTIPADIWHDFMISATQNMPVEKFPTPSQAGFTNGPAPRPTSTPTPHQTSSATPTPTPTSKHETPTPTPKHTTPSPKPTHTKTNGPIGPEP